MRVKGINEREKAREKGTISRVYFQRIWGKIIYIGGACLGLFMSNYRIAHFPLISMNFLFFLFYSLQIYPLL